jgi:hypothetical protein
MTFTCNKCNKIYKTKIYYNKHILSCNPDFIASCLLVPALIGNSESSRPGNRDPISDNEDISSVRGQTIINQEDTDEKSPINEQFSVKPLVKWSGGKSDEIKHFEKYIPRNIDTYLEPFIGGGSVFFHLGPKKAVISDVHKELIDFYKSIKDGHSEIIYKFMEDNSNDD